AARDDPLVFAVGRVPEAPGEVARIAYELEAERDGPGPELVAGWPEGPCDNARCTVGSTGPRRRRPGRRRRRARESHLRVVRCPDRVHLRQQGMGTEGRRPGSLEALLAG